MTTTLDSNTTMAELLAAFPGAQRALFRRYHIGGCASCGFQPGETIGEVCARNDGISVDEVLAHVQASHEEDQRMQISPGELADALKAGPVRMVDVRTREEFEAARIEGAQLLSQEMMQEMLANWDRGELLVFICHHGIRSIDAAAYFAGHGFTNVKSLQGGTDAWSVEVDPNVPRYHLG